MGCQWDKGCLEVAANNKFNLCPKHYVKRRPIGGMHERDEMIWTVMKLWPDRIDDMQSHNGHELVWSHTSQPNGETFSLNIDCLDCQERLLQIEQEA